MQKQLTIFYSWQSDLPNNNNRNLIQSSIDRAVKNLNKNAIAISADRDTAGKMGTPDIVDTIFKKIDERIYLLRTLVLLIQIQILGRLQIQTFCLSLGMQPSR